MLSHFSVARIKDKTAHSSLNRLLFPTAVTLPPAQRRSVEISMKFTAILYSFSGFAFRLRRRSRGRGSAGGGKPACGTGFVPRVGHAALGDAGAQPAGSAAQLLDGTRLSRLCLSRARIGGAYPFLKQERMFFVLYKSCPRTHGRPVRCSPSPTSSHAGLEVSSHV